MRQSSYVLLAAIWAAPVLAEPAAAVEAPVIAGVHAAADGTAEAELLFVNAGASAVPAPPPRLMAMLRGQGAARPVELRREGAAPVVAPGGFTRARYRFALPAGVAGEAVLALGDEGGFAFAASQPPAAAAPGATALAAADTAPAPTSFAGAAGQAGDLPRLVTRDGRTPSPFLANLQTYNPINGVFGPGTSSDGKLEISFQYQLFGNAAAPSGDWKEGFRFAYTQRMYWDLGHYSAPFRDVNYQPELFYRLALRPRANGLRLAARGGLLHESNGRGGDASRGYNYAYVEGSAALPVGRWTLSVAPRWFHYMGRDDNADIAEYRGHQALAVAIEEPDGWKLSTWSRISFATGRGAIDADLSHPLLRLTGIPIYAVVQGFTGYGEDLLDYNRRQTRLRLGIGIVR
ncbi:phospholipase A [Sphingomonas morindae]|uniref:Phospholipase A1 n=1 Tax=Sphingomonas morindae TaxID=1541170 RepID=A0ABY4X608_9SPHN|nr:phospholipase A [Sphingomonas morindae]USI72306.1 phospholipase A [Sphingomonas morindae]